MNTVTEMERILSTHVEALPAVPWYGAEGNSCAVVTAGIAGGLGSLIA